MDVQVTESKNREDDGDEGDIMESGFEEDDDGEDED